MKTTVNPQDKYILNKNNSETENNDDLPSPTEENKHNTNVIRLSSTESNQIFDCLTNGLANYIRDIVSNTTKNSVNNKKYCEISHWEIVAPPGNNVPVNNWSNNNKTLPAIFHKDKEEHNNFILVTNTVVLFV